MSLPISAILAMADDGTIGVNGTLPWAIPADMQRFRAITLGHAVIMGRKTFDSIGRALPGRRNIVVTRLPGMASPGVEFVNSPGKAYDLAIERDAEPFVIGGAQIYQALWPFVTRAYVTNVGRRYEGVDGRTFFFPDLRGWTLRKFERLKDAEPAVDFEVWERA